MKLRILSNDDVRQSMQMNEAIGIVKEAFIQLSNKKASIPVRVAIPVAQNNGVILFMPGYLSESEQMALKIVSVFNENHQKGLPLINAIVIVIDVETGIPQAVLNGTYLTALRTGAASGLATELLARKDASTVTIIGAGIQGRTQLEAVCTVRPVTRAYVYDLDPTKAEDFSRELSPALGIAVKAAGNLSEAVRQSDILCTATPATSPVFRDEDIRDGTHINAIGSYTPRMQEIAFETILRAKIVVDHYESCLSEAGDIIIPMNKGLISRDSIHAEIGEIACGSKAGRSGPQEITLFKSVGNAVQDISVASAILKKAKRLNLGIELDI